MRAAVQGRRRGTELGRRLLDRAGLEVRRTGGAGGGPRRTLGEVCAHAASVGIAPRTVVDVGVAAGTPELYAAFPGAALVLVEPMREWEAALRGVVAARPGGGEVVIAAAGPAAGERELHVHRVPACSSLVGSRVGDDAGLERRTVPVVRLDDVVDPARFPGPHVVKVDVEGGELDVLRGAVAVLEQTEMVLLETSLFALNAGAPQLADVVCWMRDHGWAPYDVFGGHLRPLDGALAQLDLAFVRRDGPARRDHRYATPEQADALYRSWGL